MVQRSPGLVWSGWILLILLYLAQVCLFISILVIHFHNKAYVTWFLWFVIPIAVIGLFIYTNKKSYADSDETTWGVWIIWGSYIFVYIVTVGTVFGTVAHKLTKNDTLGINALIWTFMYNTRTANSSTPAHDLSVLSQTCTVHVDIRRAEHLRWNRNAGNIPDAEGSKF